MLVSIKYTWRFLVVDTLEVLITPHSRHGGEHLREALAPWPQQHLLQNGAMLRFGTAPMTGGAFLERLDDLVIQIAHYQISHGRWTSAKFSMIAMLSTGIAECNHCNHAFIKLGFASYPLGY
jgi:hypothetical protein